MADQRRVGARAQREPQGIDQQALAGPGLTGEHVQARREHQAQPVDQREVVHGELEQPSDAIPAGSAITARPSRSRRQQLDLGPQQVPERHRAGRLDEPDRALEGADLDDVADVDP